MRKSQKIINLFNEKHISSIKTVFSISNEEDLDQCWQYFGDHHNQSSKSLDYFISLFYKFAHQYVLENKEYYFELILESSESHYYLTVRNKLVSKALSVFLEDRAVAYIFEHKKLTIRLDKIIEASSECEVELLPRLKQKKAKIKEAIPVFEFMDSEDLQELLVSCEDMEDIILLSKQHGCGEGLFIRLRSCFSLFLLTLDSYTQLEKVVGTIKEFSALINNYQERFQSLRLDEILLIEGFVFNVERWLRALFIEGGVALNFMDDSLQSDVETISLLINPESSLTILKEDDLDAIFDF